MKKLLILLSFLSFFLLFGCDIDGGDNPPGPGPNPVLPSDPNDNEKSLKNFFASEYIAKLDNNHVFNYNLVGFEISWYLDNEKLTDGIFVYEYTTRDISKKLRMFGKKDDTNYWVEEDITIAKTAIVNRISIATENNQEVISKDTYIKGTVDILASSVYAKSDLSMRIRGRGNSSWDDVPKKSYRIKFDKRQSLIGMAEAKDYVLLAEYMDKSLMRNYIAHYMSTYFDLDHTLESRFVEVYFNNDYRGIYLLTEQVEVDKNRLYIEESADIDAGFMIELEDAGRLSGTLNKDYFQVNSRYYNLKFPNPDDYPLTVIQQKISHIKSTLQTLETSIYNGTYANYLDVNQAIDFFILQEFTKNVDVNFSSVFIHQDKGGKIKLGPIWDMDISMGNGNYQAYSSIPSGFWATRHPWLQKLLTYSTFKQAYNTRFKEFLNNDLAKVIEEADYVYDSLKNYTADNFKKWPILEEDIWPHYPETVPNSDTYKGHYDYFKEWLTRRKTWLLGQL